MTGLSVLMAALVALPQAGLSPLALLLGVFVVGLHVGGTAIGTRLRDHANELRAWEAAQQRRGDINVGVPLLGHDQAVIVKPQVRSPLHGHGNPLRRLPMCLLFGAILGGSLGIASLTIVIGDRTSAAGIAVGAISTAVLGAWLAFVGASSWVIFRQGWRDAVAEPGRDETVCPDQS